MSEEQQLPARKSDPATGEMPDDEIDENLVESFPASDPPSWTLGTDHRPEREEEGPDVGEVTPGDRPSQPATPGPADPPRAAGADTAATPAGSG